ncbi:MAG: DUF438 domain-containing protein [Armatimonadetes bacterium]|nr:DUF438 domain-containing protein [Armatimonadota bacterium]
MDEFLNKKEVLKNIILKLHKGLSINEAKEIFENKVGTITSIEIAELEQSLINDGLSPEEIKKFCNVHALLFQAALTKNISQEESTAHPIYLFKLENREIEKNTDIIKEKIKNKDSYNIEQIKQELKPLLLKLKGIDIHYIRKEHLLFPFLEKYGFMGPSKVMWGKDNEIRDLLRNALLKVDELNNQSQINEYVNNHITPLIEEIEGMIFKEEKILFPASLEKLSLDDWVKILNESEEVGYIFIEKPKETSSLIKELKQAVIEEPEIKDGIIISYPSGEIKLKELMFLLNTLPVDITFIDKDDTVKYFTDNKNRIFVRTKSIIGRKVQNCHPPQSIDNVEEILKSFKEGKKDSFDFWINFKEKLVYIKYFALRDNNKNYLGTLEVTQDITEIKNLKGEKRLLK